MILDNFPKVLWINLNSSEERRSYMENLLKSYNIENTRISAINGVDSNSNDLDICMKHPELSDAENACSCSHLIALRYFIEKTNEDKIVIFEDDVSFEFLEYIPYNWSEFMEHLPKNYKIIQLAVIGMGRDVYPKLDIINYLYCSTTAYLITRKAAIEILNDYYPNFEKITLSNKIMGTARADEIIRLYGNTYSIPLYLLIEEPILLFMQNISVFI
jgi:GR25 family glycosyltransferase involved in LPS biosynthesis